MVEISREEGLLLSITGHNLGGKQTKEAEDNARYFNDSVPLMEFDGMLTLGNAVQGDYETRDMHRAITSLMEELEAVDWYNQRVDACKDNELKAILAHNRDEEKEHAAMVLEWIRRKDPAFDKELKDYLFTEKPISHA